MSNAIVRTPSKVLGGITPEEKVRLDAHAAKWIANAMSTEPVVPERLVPAIHALYEAAGLKQPRVVIVPSPIVMAFAGGFAAAIWWARKNSAQALNDRLAWDSDTDSDTDNATYSATSSATLSATLSATRSATFSATDGATDSATRSATFSDTDSDTDSATRSATSSATRSATSSATRSATSSATSSATLAATLIATDSATDSDTSSATRSATLRATDSATSSATRSATLSATDSDTDSATLSATLSATGSATSSTTRSATYSATLSATDSATSSTTRSATLSATDSATSSTTRSTTRSATYSATLSATDSATLSPAYFASLARELGNEFGVDSMFMLRCAQNWYRMYQGGNMWSSWDCYLTAYRDVLGLVLPEHERYRAWEACSIEGGFRIVHEEFCIVSDRPEVLLKDEQNRPHCETGPSHRWRDGWEIYFWHGVEVPREWILEKRITAAEALHWPNMEQRRAACEIIGWAKVLEELDAKVIDADEDDEIGQLLEAEIPDSGPERFLKVRCGTQRTFVLSVPRECKTALEASAWTYGIDDLANYIPEVRT